MSHFVNDQIADEAMMKVDSMTDPAVIRQCIMRGLTLDLFIDINEARDLLLDSIFDELMSVPGPHG
jgi:hypothetical protein|tara:strand:+ start:77 stop:274 length:198 start_codon:yes stop_codon:yes gene_type:complete